MSPLGLPMIGWLWAWGTLAIGAIWARGRWRTRCVRSPDVVAFGTTAVAELLTEAPSVHPIPTGQAKLRPPPAQRGSSDAVEMPRRN